MCLWDEWLCANRLYSCEQFHTMNMCSNSNNTVASVSLFLLALCLNLALNQTYALLCECKLKDAVFLLPQTPEKLLKRTTCSQVFWEFRGVQLLCSHCPCMIHYIHKSFLVTFQRKVKSKKRCPRTEWDVVWNNTPFPFWANSTIVLYCIHSSAVIRWPAYWIICFLIALVLAEGKVAEQGTFFEHFLNLRPSSMKYLELLLLCH